jgi:hypothetical protein
MAIFFFVEDCCAVIKISPSAKNWWVALIRDNDTAKRLMSRFDLARDMPEGEVLKDSKTL